MMTEVEDDQEEWANQIEEKDTNQNDPYNTAVMAVNRLSEDLGEKNCLVTFTGLVQVCVKSSDWKQRQAGYMLMGLISEACKESMKKNMEEAIKLACSGIMDEHIRVRYAGLSCLALLLTELEPRAQYKFHSELMPVLLKMMIEEPLIKMQTHVVSTLINFSRGLLSVDEEEEEDSNKGAKIMNLYST